MVLKHEFNSSVSTQMLLGASEKSNQSVPLVKTNTAERAQQQRWCGVSPPPPLALPHLCGALSHCQSTADRAWLLTCSRHEV